MARSVAKFGGERRRGLARPTGASPARNSRRGPNTSPSRPETGWATALVRWNSEIIQETQANNSSKSSASWIRATAISEELSGFSTVPEAVATSRGPRRGPARSRDPAPEPPHRCDGRAAAASRARRQWEIGRGSAVPWTDAGAVPRRTGGRHPAAQGVKSSMS